MKQIDYLKKNKINVDQSIEYFGDEDTFLEMLKDFIDALENKTDELKKFLNDNNMNDYAILVHSLKSDCRYLGITDLADLCYNHEIKSKDNDIDYVERHFDELMNLISHYSKVINIFFEDSVIEESSDEEDEKEEESYIFIVDDSEMLKIFIKKMFPDDSLLFASDGIEAIEVLKKNYNIKAMFLDLGLPKKNGFEVLDYLKEKDLFKKIPVTIITGNDNKDNINKVFEYDVIDMLNKPFSKDKINTSIEKMISFKKVND